jgi:tetratricopeptide (TPR) repeat protein
LERREVDRLWKDIPYTERRGTLGRGASSRSVGKDDAPPPRFVTDFAPDPIDFALSELGETGRTICALIESQQIEPAVKATIEHFEPLLTRLRDIDIIENPFSLVEQQLNGLAHLLAYALLSQAEADRSLIRTLSWQFKRWVNRGLDDTDAYLICAFALSLYDESLSRDLEPRVELSPTELKVLLMRPDEIDKSLEEKLDPWFVIPDGDLMEGESSEHDIIDEFPEDDMIELGPLPALDIVHDLVAIRLRQLERRGQVSDYLKLARIAKQHHRYAIMLALQGDLEGAIETARREFKETYQWLPFAKALDALGHTETALDMAVGWLREKFPITDALDVGPLTAFAEWLAARAAALGKHEVATEFIQKAYFQEPTLARYQLFQQIAGEQWEQLRPRALEHLQEVGEVEEVVEIYLYEGMYEDALKILIEEDSLVPEYAHRLVEHFPEQIRNACREQAEHFLRMTNPDLYPIAVEYLAVVKRSYQVENKLHEWDALLQKLLEQYKRKPGVPPLLQKLAQDDASTP